MNPPPTTLAHLVRDLWQQGERPGFLRLLSTTGAVESFSYREVVNLALRWAGFYAQRGLVRGSRVVVILPHSVDLYAAYLGALLGGKIPAMFAFPSAKLSTADYSRTIGDLLANAEPELVVTYAELKRHLVTLLPARAALFVCQPLDLPAVEPGTFSDDGSPDDTA
ncbi:MAG TPA: AMP-binding protein, partial [Rariglobus sp.]